MVTVYPGAMLTYKIETIINANITKYLPFIHVAQSVSICMQNMHAVLCAKLWKDWILVQRSHERYGWVFNRHDCELRLFLQWGCCNDVPLAGCKLGISPGFVSNAAEEACQTCKETVDTIFIKMYSWWLNWQEVNFAAPDNCLHQYFPRSLIPCGVARPKWIKS